MSAKGRAAHLMLTGGGDWERFMVVGACNEAMPNSWKNACRRKTGHAGLHHTWDPRTGTDKGRHPLPVYDEAGRRYQTVWAWGAVGPLRGHARMLHRSAYVAPRITDRFMVATIKSRERVPWS